MAIDIGRRVRRGVTHRDALLPMHIRRGFIAFGGFIALALWVLLGLPA